jgi:hypothetical protein
MNIKYNKNWKPTNEYNDITDVDFDKRFEIDRQFVFNTLFRKYHIRFVKYPNNNLILVNWSYIPKLPKFMSSWLEKRIFKEPYNTIWNNLCKQFVDEITELEMYSKYNYNYINPKMVKRMEIINKLLNE